MRTTAVLATVVAVVAVTAIPASGQEEAPPPEPTGDHEQVVDLTFPTDPTARFQQDYHDPRSGGRHHQATDLMGEKMWPIYAAVGGTVCFITGIDEPPPSYGYMLRVCADDGRRYSYVHINNDTPGTDDGQGGPENAYAPGIEDGARVERGQLIAYVGDSGNAESTAPHLHFEIHDDSVVDPYGGNRIDPYFSLVDALERGDVVQSGAGPTERVAGADRVATAVALSRTVHDDADVALIAPSDTPAEAIVAGPLAALLEGPVLLNGRVALDARVRDELIRLGVEQVILVGAFDDELVHDLEDHRGYDIDVLGGDDRYVTAAAVAREVEELTGTDEVLVALGDHPRAWRSWPDSLVAGYLGSVIGAPVLLVDHGELPDATADALEEFDEAVIIGGEAAVDADIEEAIEDLGLDVERLAGATRYTTATAVAEAALDTGDVEAERVWAATGGNWPDAVAAGPVVAAAGDVLVLIDGTAAGRDEDAESWFRSQRRAIASANVIGGPAAISTTAERALAERIDG